MWSAWANTEANTQLKCLTFSLAILHLSFQSSVIRKKLGFMMATYPASTAKYNKTQIRRQQAPTH
jgi:hypothetical protein